MRICPECQRSTDLLTCPHDGTPTIDETLLRETADPLLGTELAGRFRLLEPLGRGGMGRVYLADQIAMKRRVAVKVIRAETLSEVGHRMDLVRRFHREALAASRLHHPNTVRIFDYGSTDDGLLFIAMELLIGPTLSKVLRTENRLAPRRAAHIAAQVCKSLSEAHQVGIVHRDLKPDNIILTDVAGEEDFVKVLDFGIAKVALPGSDSGLTHSGMVMGTPAYMAPEQGRASDVGPAADIYSLGVILYHCLTGQQLFPGETPLEILMKHAQDPVPPMVVDGFPPDLPPALEALVRSMLAKRAQDRPGPALEVARRLEACCGNGRGRTESPEEGEPTVSLDTVVVEHRDGPTPEAFKAVARHGRRGRWLAAGVLFAGIVVVGLLALLWTGFLSPSPDEAASSSYAAPPPVLQAEKATPQPATTATQEEAKPARPVPEYPAPVAAPAQATAPATVTPAPTPVPVPPAPKPPKPAPATTSTKPASPPGKLPPCSALKCPFTRDCIGPDGLRTKGDDYCLPVF